jgi:hypothetical protein
VRRERIRAALFVFFFFFFFFFFSRNPPPAPDAARRVFLSFGRGDENRFAIAKLSEH